MVQQVCTILVNMEYKRRLSTQPCGAPVLSISVTEMFLPPHLGSADRESRTTQLQRDEFRPRALSLVTRLWGTMVWNAEQ